MIDPLDSLAFSVQSNKGVYALLLGSGVSRSAQIPTGRDIVLDLIRKLAILESEDCEPDPAVWYKSKFGEDPDYSKLLSQVVYSAPERRELLRPYFEPTKEEREEGLKLSTEAHQAIANLVASGYIRVIITTNFDRLLESALGNRGIAPIVINTEEAAKGVLPLITHSAGCIIVKVNGDYLDPQTKNTADELKHYPEPIEKLLDRIFDEFGLIVCGWSGDSDIALRAALEKCSNHRFTTYWMDMRDPTGNASNLIELRRGKFIQIQNADRFFCELDEKVFALEEYSKPHPLSVKALVAQIKKYIVDDRYKISLQDLVYQEVAKLYSEISDEKKFPLNYSKNKIEDEIKRRIQLYESLTEPVLSMVIVGSYWGNKSHDKLWTYCIERMANLPGERHGIGELSNLRLYPALLLLYGGGIASIAAEKYDLLYSLLMDVAVRDIYEEGPAAQKLNVFNVMNENIGNVLDTESPTPTNEQIYKVLREPLKDIITQDTKYQKYFYRFEYLSALVESYLNKKQGKNVWSPVGPFCWGYVPPLRGSIMEDIDLEIETVGSNWQPLQAGLFRGSIDEFKDIKKECDQKIHTFVKSQRLRSRRNLL
ncbi:MAG TPA: SIR2 family protein [Methanothrix sp.]|nr:SIR2 family protein [Methanothrix sp.]HPJ83741.1 SIR2 family protein [Methanothrix sp.]